MFNWHIKERPILSLTGLSGGVSRNSKSPGIFIGYAVIAGGGGGGGELSGGGGAGGMRVNTYEVAKGYTYSITVGNGGSPESNPVGGAPSGLYYRGAPGGPSTFATITATGGGGGDGYFYGQPLTNGGSGGGAAEFGVGQGNSPPVSPPQGNPGGLGNAYGAGGGGGAGTAGGSHLSGQGPTPPAGNGGDGASVNWPEIPASYGAPGPNGYRWFAGGGAGGGGVPGYSRAFPGTPGIAANTYGGGGAGGGTPSSVGSPGVQGIVMLRIPISMGYVAPAAAPFTSPTHRVLIWTGPGSITIS